jgi:histidyl-tRNA synthetase
VGISIGLSRLFSKMLGAGRVQVGPKCPTEVLVVFPSEEQRKVTRATARTLRERGFKVETYHAPGKISHQLRYASRKGIPFVWFPPFDAAGLHEVKEMASGQQAAADPAVWQPPPQAGQASGSQGG